MSDTPETEQTEQPQAEQTEATEATQAAPAALPQSPMKIVIVAGQELEVAREHSNEAIKQQLRATFPDVANAEIKVGKRVVNGMEYETVEFVKRAGTKGSDDLAALLAGLPPAWSASFTKDPLARLMDRVMSGTMPIEEALEVDLDAVSRSRIFNPSTEGAQLCAKLDALPAVPADTIAAGW